MSSHAQNQIHHNITLELVQCMKVHILSSNTKLMIYKITQKEELEV